MTRSVVPPAVSPELRRTARSALRDLVSWGPVLYYLLWTQSYFVEKIGNANEEVVRAYVKNQLINVDKIEVKSKQLKLF